MKDFLQSGTWAITLVLAAVGAGYLYFGFLPARAHIDELRRELAQKKAYLAEQQGVKVSLQIAEEKLRETGEYVDHWKENTPQPRDVSRMFAKITASVRASGASLDKFDPLAPLDYESLQKVPIHMAVRGSFPQIHELLRSLERLPSTVWVEGMKIESTSDKSKVLVSEINLAVFAVNPEISD
ncbi:MAG: type 4a pilus biogenesis protein PilO [Planctomycetia bacterium]|nr:type 4a pilus biogenesis protein PilO [Planctomycetia bacterium]